MQFIKNAQDKVLQKVGLAAAVENDEVLLAYKTRLDQLENIVLAFKGRFTKYAEAMQAAK